MNISTRMQDRGCDSSSDRDGQWAAVGPPRGPPEGGALPPSPPPRPLPDGGEGGRRRALLAADAPLRGHRGGLPSHGIQ